MVIGKVPWATVSQHMRKCMRLCLIKDGALLPDFTKIQNVKLPRELPSLVAGCGLSLLERATCDFLRKLQTLPVCVISDAVSLKLKSIENTSLAEGIDDMLPNASS